MMMMMMPLEAALALEREWELLGSAGDTLARRRGHRSCGATSGRGRSSFAWVSRELSGYSNVRRGQRWVSVARVGYYELRAHRPTGVWVMNSRIGRKERLLVLVRRRGCKAALF